MTALMTRFVLALLFLTLPVFAAKKPDCQPDLFVKPPSSPVVDMIQLQRRVWTLEREGDLKEADAVRVRLISQLKLNKRKDFAAQIHNHRLYRANPLNFSLFRSDTFGFKEFFAYDLNEVLGRPVKIPATGSQVDGSLQLWMFYDFEDEILSREEDEQLNKALDADADLFLFNFLMANTDQNFTNVIKDPEFGLVVFDFGAALKFSARQFAYATKPKQERTKNLEEITVGDVEKLLKEKLANARFDWKAGLNRLDTETLGNFLRKRIGPIEAREFVARVCFLKAVLARGNPALCKAL